MGELGTPGPGGLTPRKGKSSRIETKKEKEKGKKEEKSSCDRRDGSTHDIIARHKEHSGAPSHHLPVSIAILSFLRW